MMTSGNNVIIYLYSLNIYIYALSHGLKTSSIYSGDLLHSSEHKWWCLVSFVDRRTTPAHPFRPFIIRLSSGFTKGKRKKGNT